MGRVGSTGVTACAGSRFDYEALTDPLRSGKIHVCILNRFTKMAFSRHVPTAIGFDMTTEEFRRRAADCLRWAQEAANERTKGLWLNMAQIWLDRAEISGASSKWSGQIIRLAPSGISTDQRRAIVNKRARGIPPCAIRSAAAGENPYFLTSAELRRR
jgi:hypothetical protein